MTPDIAYPRPAPINERIAVRGCRNCVYFDPDALKCRLRPPFHSVARSDFCGEWRWIVNTRVAWESAFAPAELFPSPRPRGVVPNTKEA